MITAAEIETALRPAVPEVFHSHVPVFASILAETLNGRLAPAEAHARMASDAACAPLLQALAGRRIGVSGQTLAFPPESQARSADTAQGDVAIVVGDYAGGGIDRRQGVFVSGGVIGGPVIGVNQGTFNYYQLEIGAAGTKLNDGAASAVKVLDSVSIVPRAARIFYDREETIGELQAELRPGGGAWVSGERGCGLTTLLRKVANLPAAALPNGALYLDGALDPADLDETLRRLYNYYHSGNAPIAITPEEARAFLSTRQALFVLDRLPLGHDELVALSDTLSRGAVLIAAEGTAPESLADLPLPGLPAGDALRLCVGTAGLDGAQPEVAALVGKLCARLDCLPLPLVIAGRLLRTKVAAPEQILAVLEDLASSGEAADRQPLALAARLALPALDDAERGVLAALAHTGRLGLDALAAISALPDAAIDPALKRLADLGLVSSGNERYQIASGSLRRVLERLLPFGEERKRAAAFFAAAAFEARAGDLAWLAREQQNLVNAIHTLIETGQASRAGALAQALQPALVLEGQWSAWGGLIDLAAQAAQITGDRALRAWALHERGTRAGLLGDTVAAATDLGEARRARLELGDQAGADVSLHNLRYLDLLPPPGTPGQRDSGGGALARAGWVVPAAVAAIVAALVAGSWLLGGPTASAAAAATTPGRPVSVDVLGRSGGGSGLFGAAAVSVVSPPGHGAATADPATGAITYTPDPEYIGDDRFTYQLCNALQRCASADVTVAVASRPPIAQGATATTAPNTAVSIDVLGAIQAQDGRIEPATLQIVQGPANGIASVDPATGAISYTPTQGFSGDDRFSYQACDTFGKCAAADVAVSVVNRPPVATDLALSTSPQAPLTIDALDNIVDPDGALDPAAVAVVQQPAGGSASVDPATGAISYTPTQGFSGGDRFSYQICDSFGACATANVSIDVVKRPLVANDITRATNPQTQVDIDVLQAVDAPDSTLDPASVETIVEQLRGQLAVNSRTGAISYTPPRDFVGDERFGYRVCDTQGDCATGSVTVSVERRPLIANDIAADTFVNNPVTIDVLGQVVDPDGALDRQSLKVASGPASGAAESDAASGTITYAPSRGFSGDDRFRYQVCDIAGACVDANVAVTVRAAFIDAFAYCEAVGTVDAPDERYAGPAVPDEIVERFSEILQLPGGRVPNQFIVWRCMEERVYACWVGANLPCGKANTSRTPNESMIAFCRENPNDEGIPAVSTGHDTIYAWRCVNGAPEAGEQIFTVDQQGFVADFWYEIPPG